MPHDKRWRTHENSGHIVISDKKISAASSGQRTYEVYSNRIVARCAVNGLVVPRDDEHFPNHVIISYPHALTYTQVHQYGWPTFWWLSLLNYVRTISSSSAQWVQCMFAEPRDPRHHLAGAHFQQDKSFCISHAPPVLWWDFIRRD